MMEWLLIVTILSANTVYDRGFETKEECMYVGSWFIKENDKYTFGNIISAKCFEVKKNDRQKEVK